MELRHLRHFSAVIETGNLSRAAERVFISQPALTRSIKNLEDLLGAALLERRPRGVIPTPAGDALYRYAKLVLNECDRARSEVRAVQSGAKGELSIGIASMFADHIVDKAVARVCVPGSQVSMSITQGFLEDLVEALLNGELDLIFSNLALGMLPEDVSVEPIYEVRAYVYAAPTHPLADRKRLTKQDLLSEPWAVVDQPHMRTFLDRYFSGEGLRSPPYVVRTNSLNLIRSLLGSGGFVGILPEHLVRRRARRGEIRRLDAPDCPVVRQAGLITRSSTPIRPVLATFMNELREAAREI